MRRILSLAAAAALACTGPAGSNGRDGSDGPGGLSCTATREEGGVLVACEDGTRAFVPDGRDGEDGRDGIDGTGCTLTPNDDGTRTLVCGDGTRVVLPEASRNCAFDPDFVRVDGGLWEDAARAESRGVVSTPGGLFWMTVVTEADGPSRVVVSRTRDGGITWSVVDDFDAGGAGARQGNIAASPSGALFSISAAASSAAWVVRRSLDDGDTWQTVDEALFGAAQRHVWAGADGLVLTGGRIDPGGRWAVRMSRDHGRVWETIDEFKPDGFAWTEASVVRGAAGGLLWAAGVGRQPGAASLNHAFVRRSRDGGATWATVAEFAHPEEHVGLAALVVTPAGTLLAAARHEPGPDAGETRGVMHRSTDGGATWTAADGFEGLVSGATVDGAGRVLVAASVSEGDAHRMFLRMSDDDGLTWGEVSQASGDVAMGGASNRVLGAFDSAGDLWVTAGTTRPPDVHGARLYRVSCH